MLKMMNNFITDSKPKYFMVNHDFLQLTKLTVFCLKVTIKDVKTFVIII